MTQKPKLSSSIADFNGVALKYANGPEILRDINFSLEPGSFHFMTGESGAGKSSLLSMLYLDRMPSKGRVRLFGYPLDTLSRSAKARMRRQIGVVFQDYRLLNHLNAFDNVALPLRIAGAKESDIKRHVSEMLSWVGLEKQMRAFPPELSGGEKQRIAIARAVINRPRILLADEPTGNVDNDIAPKLMKLFVELNKLGTTVVIATHSEKLITDFMYPRLHLQNRSLRVYPPAKVFGLGGGNER